MATRTKDLKSGYTEVVACDKWEISNALWKRFYNDHDQYRRN